MREPPAQQSRGHKYFNMKIFTKIALVAVATLMLAGETLAGGLMTNSNQSASFLRSIARGTSLDPDAVHTNPAGTVFMSNGFHFGISDQMAYQTRTINSTYAPFAMGAQNNGLTSKEFKGTVFSPLIPSFHFVWKHNRWSVMAGMGVNGGGGELKFDKGLGSFERMFSVLPVGMNQLGINATAYDLDMQLIGKSQTLAFQVGAAFRINDWLSIAAQLRYSTTSNAYEGHMKNIGVVVGGQKTPASVLFQGALTQLQAQYQQVVGALGAESPEAQQLMAAMQSVGANAVKTADHILDVKQKGHSISPVIALYGNWGKWTASVKYEFKMATELEIESAPVSANDAVINSLFPNGAKVKAETPALLSIAISRQLGPVKLTIETHDYFDKNAENSFSSAVDGNTSEILFGAEWQVCKKLMLSAGVQRTQTHLISANYSDMNFLTPSTSVGFGVAYNFSEKVRLNLGIMPTFYDKVTSTGVVADTQLPFTDVYDRTSLAWGIGLDFNFGK